MVALIMVILSQNRCPYVCSMDYSNNHRLEYFKKIGIAFLILANYTQPVKSINNCCSDVTPGLWNTINFTPAGLMKQRKKMTETLEA